MIRTLVVCAVLLLLFHITPSTTAAPIDAVTAIRVAENTFRNHILRDENFPQENFPALLPVQSIIYKDRVVAYNFPVVPQGHILVAADDLFSPVLLYSATSSFDRDRIDTKNAIEYWIIREVYEILTLTEETVSGATADPVFSVKSSANESKTRIRNAWSFYTGNKDADSAGKTAQYAETRSIQPKDQTSVAPLLSTRWEQSFPYNMYAPTDSRCTQSRPLAGCVAIAFAQVANYWQWPPIGKGSNSYSWNGKTLSTDFTNRYQWELMPSTLSASSPFEEQSAVAHLISDMGIAVNMQYGCTSSGSSAWADEILDTYFRYKKTMRRHYRKDFSPVEWLSLIQQELDATPPRPIIFSIFGTGSGHETVIDGYQTGVTDKVHINFGWNDGYDGYYDITTGFSSGAIQWLPNTQVIVTGIEPDDEILIADAGMDSEIIEGNEVLLYAYAIPPAGTTIVSYEWIQTQGPAVTIEADSDPGNQARFIAPDVPARETLTFRLRVTDSDGSVGEDIRNIIVRDPSYGSGNELQGTSSTEESSPKSSGRAGGCFITSLMW